MASGYEINKARKAALTALGRALARRAHAHCELCTSAGARLTALEVPPLPPEPELEHTLFLCDRCLTGVQGGKVDDGTWRFLEETIWSELGPVQVTAVRMARRLSLEGAGWATELLANVYLSPEIEAWVAQDR